MSLFIPFLSVLILAGLGAGFVVDGCLRDRGDLVRTGTTVLWISTAMALILLITKLISVVAWNQ